MANQQYTVKTRNWRCNRIVLAMLSLSLAAGVVRGDIYEDGDGKFYLETNSAFKAWVVWAYFMLLRHWSGGWTYIVTPTATDFEGYRSIYT